MSDPLTSQRKHVMPKRYKEFRRLSNGHSRGITTVAFSGEGSYVATGGLDGKVCIWGLQSGKLLHLYAGQSSILCLEWMPSREDSLLCGSQNGNVTVLTIAAVCNQTGLNIQDLTSSF